MRVAAAPIINTEAEMGWETIEHSCGHEERHDLYGNRSWRDRQAARLENEPCSTCKQAERDKENRKAAAENAEAGYPPLEGTEKQIAWAETIRRDMLAVADVVDEYWSGEGLAIHEVQALFRQRGQEQLYMPAHIFADACMALLAGVGEYFGKVGREDFMRTLCGQTRASWWIDHRGDYSAAAKDIAASIKQDAPDETENSLAAREAKQEAILRPESAVVCDTVVELALAGGRILVKPPEKREDFQQVMRLTGCKWDSERRRYVFRPGRRDGDPLDRMAEITHALVAEGFLVCLFDEEARRRAIERDFQPRQTRWVGLDGDWLTIEWKRPDDFYESARDLPGSRYKDGRVLVPTNAIDDVADWAEENEFALEPAVTQLMESKREAILNAIVLRNPQAAREAETGEIAKKPRKLKTPTETGIDEELRDDD